MTTPGTELRTASVNGVELAYFEAGDPTAPLVLCLHGFPDSPATYRHLVVDLVGAGFRVVTPYLRGYPPSQVVPGPYQVAALAWDAIRLAETLAPGRPAFLVGHDWGGVATYASAVLAPERWQRVVVLSVPPSRLFREFLRSDWDQQRAAWYQYLFQMEPPAERVVAEDDFVLIDRLWRSWSPDWAGDPDVLAAAKRSIREGFPASLLFYRDTWQPDRQDPALRTDQQRILDGPVTVPTLLLHGLRDGCVLPGAYADAATYFTGPVHVEAVPQVGHFLHLEDPPLVDKTILAFLTEAPVDVGTR